MNKSALFGIGVWLARRGGLQAVDDLATLGLAYHALPSPLNAQVVKAALSPPNVQAAARLGKLLVSGLLDASEGPAIEAEIKSL